MRKYPPDKLKSGARRDLACTLLVKSVGSGEKNSVYVIFKLQKTYQDFTTSGPPVFSLIQQTTLYILLISSQSAPKFLEFVGHALLQFTDYTASSGSDFNPSGIRSEARAALWMLQCVQQILCAESICSGEESSIVPSYHPCT